MQCFRKYASAEIQHIGLGSFVANGNLQMLWYMKQAQGITECLKEENALEWTEKINNIRACAIEIIENEIIYA